MYLFGFPILAVPGLKHDIPPPRPPVMLPSFLPPPCLAYIHPLHGFPFLPFTLLATAALSLLLHLCNERLGIHAFNLMLVCFTISFLDLPCPHDVPLFL